jgi:hypothetical protein
MAATHTCAVSQPIIAPDLVLEIAYRNADPSALDRLARTLAATGDEVDRRGRVLIDAAARLGWVSSAGDKCRALVIDCGSRSRGNADQLYAAAAAVRRHSNEVRLRLAQRPVHK